MKRNLFNPFSGAIVAAGLALSACGPQPFVPNSNGYKESAGFMNIPPRVDVVLGLGRGGTMSNIIQGIDNEIPSFAQSLQNSGWDYRFVSIPLHESFPANSININNKVSVSQFHTNYVPFGTWKSPFPGATNTDPTLTLLNSLFNIGFYVPTNLNPPVLNGRENGLEALTTFVNRADVNTGAADTGFIRPDAMLAVIVLSNEDDRSGGTWRCKWNPVTASYPSTCDDSLKEWVAPAVDNLPAYANSLYAAKGGNSALVKYYSVVAPPTVYCRSGVARYGERYGVKFKNIVGGKYIDLCANEIRSSLEQIKNDLVTQKLNFRKRYLVLQNKPNVGTIKITKYAGGTGAGQVLVQGDPNGWQYLGGPQTVYTIDSPVPMAQASGYVIELLGNGRLSGNDTADVDYMNDGQVVQ